MSMHTFDVVVVWDPVPDDDLDRYLVFRAAELPIIGVDQGAKKFSIDGHYASWFRAGDSIVISGSTGNDGTYTIVASTQPSGLQVTELEVAEAIPSATVDGYLANELLSELAYAGKSNGFTDKLMPRGFYYYAIYAVDKVGNFSDPGDIVVKSSPPDVVGPATPAGVRAVRSKDLGSIEITWNDNSEMDLKGYAVFRDVGSGFELIATTASNKYLDSAVPPAADTARNATSCSYAIAAYDKYFNLSVASAPTAALLIPLITGLRAVVDYLSLDVYWNVPLPETMPDPANNKFVIYYRKFGTTPWTVLASVDYPISYKRIVGPLDQETVYEIGLLVEPYSGSVQYLQPETVLALIPKYLADTTPPTGPELEVVELDPRQDRLLLSWSRRLVDDDLLYYDVKWSSKWNIAQHLIPLNDFRIVGDVREFFPIGGYVLVEGATANNGEHKIIAVALAGGDTFINVDSVLVTGSGGTIKSFLTYSTTKQNELVFRNPRRAWSTGSPDYEMYFRVDAVDRSNNRTKGSEVPIKLKSLDAAPPQWYDAIQVVQTGYKSKGQHFELRWDAAAGFMKYFRRYVIYESISWNPLGYPNFTFSDHEVAGFSTDAYFRFPTNELLRGSTDTGKEGRRWIVIAVEDWWGDIHIYDPGAAPNFVWLELPAAPP